MLIIGLCYTLQRQDVLNLAINTLAHLVSIDTDGWQVQLRLPLETVGIDYAPGAELGFNIGVRRLETQEWICWTGTHAQNWQLDDGGRLVLE